MPTTRKQVARRRPVNNRPKSVIDRIGEAWEGAAWINLSLYGRSGTGKTTVWSTFPKPILAIICGGIKKPGELKSIATPENKKVIHPVIIGSSDEIRELFDYQKETKKFRTVVLDHVTGLQDLILKEILGLEELPAQGSWGMAKQRDWGQCTAQTKEYLRSMLNLPECNTVIIAQERTFGDDLDNDLITPTVGSAVTPSLCGWLNQAVDYIGQTYIRQKIIEKKVKIGGEVTTQLKKGDGVEYCMRTAPSEVYTTKFRRPLGSEPVPECIVDPGYDKIMELIGD